MLRINHCASKNNLPIFTKIGAFSICDLTLQMRFDLLKAKAIDKKRVGRKVVINECSCIKETRPTTKSRQETIDYE